MFGVRHVFNVFCCCFRPVFDAGGMFVAFDVSVLLVLMC